LTYSSQNTKMSITDQADIKMKKQYQMLVFYFSMNVNTTRFDGPHPYRLLSVFDLYVF
jgi:hypothetical protein